MAKLTKHHFSSLIRSARPGVQPDREFIDHLAVQLQLRSQELADRREIVAQPRRRLSHWFTFGPILGLGAVAVVLAIMIIPGWFQPNTPLTGYIQKGPFISGSAITVQELDDRLQPTGVSYQVTTNSDFGDYRLTQNLTSDYVEVIAQGYYYNEITGELSSGPLTLRAIADVSENAVVNVNVLTTLTIPRLRHIMVVDEIPVAEAKKIAEQEVLTIFQIPGEVAAGFEDMNISQAGDDNAILLATSVVLQGQQSVAELSELLSKLSLAMKTDGTIDADGPLVQTLRANADGLHTAQIKKNLARRFADLGIAAEVPEFDQWLTPFLSSADPLGYELTLLNNVFGVNRTSGASIKVTIYGEGFVAGQETVSLKESITAIQVEYIDVSTLVATFPIDQLSAGSYTVVVRNNDTGRLGVTDGLPIEPESTDVEHRRLILRGYTPTITAVTEAVPYLIGGTIDIQGENFAYGTFVWINGWQMPSDAVRVINNQLISVDLSPALIVEANLPRNTDLAVTVQTPDFQTAEYTGFQIR
ncbi:MAG TPA: hypothetical protein DEG44_03980 [Candidatus Kerfeldbacteria bacterium]|nr:hypothetical protein [Candidatus Kerfeldbacteria bacterium]